MANHSATWLQWLQNYRAIAVIRSPDVKLTLAMARAVARGGMRLIEITWNSNQPATSIAQLRAELPSCLIGTGTILNLEQLREAVACGAQFCFSPHLERDLIQVATQEYGIPLIPGALSPTEIVSAWQAGASCVKVFPIQAVGGANYIKSLQGPLGQIPLIPTGGVTLANAGELIEAGAIAVGLSGELFPKPLVAAGNWEAIASQASLLWQGLCGHNERISRRGAKTQRN